MPTIALADATPRDENAEAVGALLAAPLFAGVLSAETRLPEDLYEMRTYEDGETIASIGQRDLTEFLVILEGGVTVSRLDEGSNAMVFESHEAGDALGLAAAICGENGALEDSKTVIARSRTRIAAIDGRAFWSLARSTPALMERLALTFARALTERDATAVAPEGAAERAVYSALIKLCEPHGPERLWRIARLPRHRELAEIALSDEETAARAIARLIQDGIARRSYPALDIIDFDALRRLAN